MGRAGGNRGAGDGLAGLGVGIYSVATTPAKTSGPQGPAGPPGLPAQKANKDCREHLAPKVTLVRSGRQAPSAATSISSGTVLTSPPDPPVGTVLVAKTTCPNGKILLSGGAQVSAPGVVPDRNVDLRSSFPLTNNQWQTVAIVTGPLGAGVSMSMKPYVVCGVPTTTGASTTTTT